MKLDSILRIALGGWVLVSALLTPPTTASEIEWLERTSTAFDEAKESARPLIVDLWAVWCEPCKLMDETTYRDARVVDMMDGFVPLKLNVDANEQFVARYSVEAFPTTLFLDGDGEEIGRLAGMIEADGMLAALRVVREGYSDYLNNATRRDDATSLRAAAAYLLDLGNADGAARVLRSALKTAKKNAPESVDAIELDLCAALVAEERAGAAVKTLERLSVSASSAEVRGQALVQLVRVERERGRDAKAQDALARLTKDYPELEAAAVAE